MSDPIADLLTRMRNAKEAQHRYVDVFMNTMNVEILKVLVDKGFIEAFLPNDTQRKVRVFLKYSEGRKPLIQGLKRISKPSLRRYVSYKKIPILFKGLGVAILSTPQGICDGETARKMRVGGELLCYIW